MTARVFGAHGHAFTYEVDNPGLAARVERMLSTLELPGRPARSTYRVIRNANGNPELWHNEENVGFRLNDESITMLFQWHVNQEVIARATEKFTTFHAAAARSPRGSGVLLAAPMEAGKTTTVTGLLQAGWDFLTDEAAAVTPEGTILAYPKALTIDSGSWDLFADLRPVDFTNLVMSWLVPAPEVGADVVASAPLRLIVFPRYTRGEQTRAIPVSASEAALELAHSTFRFEVSGARDLTMVSWLARTVPAYRLEIGSLAEAVSTIETLERVEVAA